MVVLNKIIRKSVSLLVRVLAVYVTPTYFFLLCSASQCNKRHHNYEQVFVANQQSESSKRSSSTTEEDASKASQVKVSDVDIILTQEVIEQIKTTRRTQKATPLEESIPSIDETDSTPQDGSLKVLQAEVVPVDRTLMQEVIEQLKTTRREQDVTPLEESIPAIEKTDSNPQDGSPKVSQAEVNEAGRTLMQEQPEATLLTQKSTPLEKSIPSTEEIEEIDSTTEEDASEASQAEVNDAGRTLMQEQMQKQIERLKATLITQEETLLERNIPSIKKTCSDPQDSLPKVSQAEVNDVGRTLMQEEIEQLEATLLLTPEVDPPLKNIITTSFHDDEMISLLGEASERTSNFSTEITDTPKDLIRNLVKWKKREYSSKNLHQGDEDSINNIIRLLSDGEKID